MRPRDDFVNFFIRGHIQRQRAMLLQEAADLFPNPVAHCFRAGLLPGAVAVEIRELRLPAFPEMPGCMLVAEEAAARPEDADRALTEALSRLSPSEAATEVARALGLPRRDLYRRALDLKGAR